MSEAVHIESGRGLTDEQMEIRRLRVGASEVAALIPLLADGTPVHIHGHGPMDVWASKNGVQKPQSAEQRWGQIVEASILSMHCETQCLKPLPNPGTLVHPKYPWMCVTPDLLAVAVINNRRRHVEAKNSGRWMAHLWGPEGTGDVPIGYAAQTQVTLDALLALGLVDDEETDLAACIGGMPPVVYVVDRRPELVERLAALAFDFVEKHLKPGIPPEQGWSSDAAEAWLRKKHPVNTSQMLEPDLPDVRLARQVAYAQARIKKWESVEAEGKNRLRARIGPAEGIRGIATNIARADGARVLRLIAKERRIA